MANVLLINPDPKSIHPRYPSALLPLAGVLRSNSHRVEIFDGQFQDCRNIKLAEYDVVGITSLTGPQIHSALKIARWIKTKAKTLPLIWGGVHCSLVPEQTAAHELVDVAVRGEGEESFLELIEAIQKRQSLEIVKGITFKQDGKIVSTAERDCIELDKLPYLPFELLPNFHKYSNIKRKIMYFQTSRGCPYSCGFCYSNRVHKGRWRAMSAERAVEEIKYICDTFHPETISFIDDEFFVDQRRVGEICQKLIDAKVDIQWGSSGRYDQAYKYTSDFLKLLKASGCVGVSFGGESGSTRVLESINKRITVEQMKTTVEKFKENNLFSTVNFMSGFPGEKKEDIFKTFDLIDELTRIDPGLMVNSISVYTPFPNTPMYKEALEYGFREPRSLEEWGEFFYNDVSNLPWLEKETRSLLKTISLLTECEFNRKGAFKSTRLFEDSPIKKIAYTGLSFLAKWRWRNRNFRFPVEWRLLDAGLRFIKSGER
ncbi:MAG: radical SAM protein [Candidatus Omnitrophota bacterium]|jgi:radical SAM superfamily enzyme YgiQ (UPF0313 family)|nr:MAG: radical SAM protein [Candidatus Omnitrophota bacterium]